MKRIFILLVLGMLLLGCTSNAPTAQPAANQTAPNGTGPATIIVHIQNFAFNPAMLTVSKGDTVQWVNDDSAPHQVKFPDFQSAVLSNGDTFEHTFDTAGSFMYSCAIHPYMQGEIIVQ